MNLKAVVYARVSTNDQATSEKASIPEQIRWAKEEAEHRGWEWITEYIEPGVTGDTEIDKRPKLSQLLEDSKLHKFNIVMVYYSSRLSRETDIGLNIVRRLGQNKVQTFIRNFGIEVEDPENFYWGKNPNSTNIYSQAFTGDFKENVERGEKATIGARGLAERGTLRNAPYGYTKTPEFKTNELGRQVYTWHFDIDPKTSQIVKRIFREYVSEGGSMRQLMINLNKDNIPSPSGHVGKEAWTTATLRNILSDYAYIGKVRWGRKLGSKYKQGKYEKSGKARRVYTLEDKWIITDGKNFEGFIDPKIWEAVKDKVKRRGLLSSRAIASPGLLSGLVTCSKCERRAYHKCRMAKKRDGSKYFRADYICQSYIRSKTCVRYLMAAKKLDEIVVGEVAKMAKSFKGELGETELPNSHEESKVDELRKTRESILRKQERLTEAYEADALSLDLYGVRNKKLDIELLAVNQQIERGIDTMSSQEQLKENRKKLIDLLGDFEKEFERADFKRKKDLIHSIIGGVLIRDGNVSVIFI